MKNKFIKLSNGMMMPLFSSGYGRESVSNDAEAREAAVCNAAEVPADDEDGWVCIAPYGIHPGSREDRPQYFFETEANAVVAEFQSLRGRLGRMFRGIPIYIGHPDSRPDVYTDHRRLGKYTDLAVRPDGLYAREELNSLGAENKREGFWVYPSPRWDAPAGRPQFRPSRLISVGLTNTPRIAASEPVANSTLANEQTENTTTIMDRKLLCEKLGLEVTATDEEILAKIARLNSAEADTQAKLTEKTGEMETAANSITTLTADLTSARERLTQVETALTTERETLANTMLDAATADGRITPADRATWLPRLTGDTREDEINALGALKPQLNTKSIDVTHSRVEIGDEKQRRETIANAVDTIRREKGLSYDDAWTAAKNDPALKGVWEAMKTES